MHIFKEIEPLRAYLKPQIFPAFSIGFVPTMGALHAGHLSLIEESKKQNNLTVCSIYVNPTQFTNQEDLIKYPRTLENDVQLLGEAGCDVLFCPGNEEMYSKSDSLSIMVGPVGNKLEGEFRPGHFNGVVLIVSKLFNIVQPQRAYFGQKDFQQFLILQQMVKDLKFDIELNCVPIIREPDGLAMSSRNLRLSPEERKSAAVLYASLQQASKRILNGESFALVKAEVTALCADNGVLLEYLVLADRRNLTTTTVKENGILLIAARVGEIRLIDNLFVVE